jgi:hypothetical protein
MTNRDTVLLETVRTHRARLAAAFLFGELADLRVANSNVPRFVAGIVIAAIACAGCIGAAFLINFFEQQAAEQQLQEQVQQEQQQQFLPETPTPAPTGDAP